METNYISVMIDTKRDKKQMAWQGWLYAVQRIDLLIVSISGAGVYVCLETLKYHKEHPLCYIVAIKISGVFLMLAILVNLISQFTGKSANHHDMLMRQCEIDDIEKPSDETKNKIAKHDCKSDVYSNWTDVLNLISLLLMIIGLITLMVFFMFSF